MCGLVGVAGNVNVKTKDIFTELLLVDVVRGHHSTGTAVVKRADNEILIDKAPIPSPIFIGTKQYKDMIEAQNLKLLLGHNRYATIGEKTVANSHPFKFDNLVGAHNGTLDKWALNALEDHALYGTDSEAIYASIAKFGLKPTISELSGAWALTWFEKDMNTMNLLRNKERPLFYAYSKDREALFWASECDMLEWVIKRNKIDLFENGVFECEADMHYRWTIPANQGGKFEKPVCAKVEGYTFQHIKDIKAHFSGSSTSGSGAAYGAVTDTPKYTAAAVSMASTAANVNPPHTKPKFQRVNTKKFRPPYKDAYGKIINKVKFNELVKSGCVFCEDCTSEWGDFILPVKDDIEGRKLYLCEDCYNDDEILELVNSAL